MADSVDGRVGTMVLMLKQSTQGIINLLHRHSIHDARLPSLIYENNLEEGKIEEYRIPTPTT
jgi:hypothetical protein